jgi:excisionase family DNA binding protein
MTPSRVRALGDDTRATEESPGAPVPRLLSLPDLASQAGLKRRHVYALVRSGRLPSIRIGRGWYISTAAFASFVGGGS